MRQKRRLPNWYRWQDIHTGSRAAHPVKYVCSALKMDRPSREGIKRRRQSFPEPFYFCIVQLRHELNTGKDSAPAISKEASTCMKRMKFNPMPRAGIAQRRI
jgi:hypothetical protein